MLVGNMGANLAPKVKHAPRRLQLDRQAKTLYNGCKAWATLSHPLLPHRMTSA